MDSKKKTIYRSSESGQFIVGAQASAHISKVEGLTLSKDMKATFKDCERKGMPADARRAAPKDKYGKKGS